MEWKDFHLTVYPSVHLEAWVAGTEAWLAGPEVWLARPEAWLTGPEGGLRNIQKISPLYRTSSHIGAAAQKKKCIIKFLKPGR